MTQEAAKVQILSLTKEEIRVQEVAIELRKALILFSEVLLEHARSKGFAWKYGDDGCHFPLQGDEEHLTRTSAGTCRKMAESLRYGLMCLPYQDPTALDLTCSSHPIKEILNRRS